MAYALSTQGQGSTSYISIPDFVPNADSATGGTSFFEIEYELHELAVNGFGYIAASTSTGLTGLSVTGDLALRLAVSTSARVTSANGVAALNRKDLLRVEYDDTGDGATAQWRLYHRAGESGTLAFIGSWVGSIGQNSTWVNTIGRFGSTRFNAITVYRVACGSSSTPSANYSAEWNGESATGTGTTWSDTLAANNLTIIGFTGAADSWWINYSAGGGTFTASVNGTYPQYTATSNADNVKPTFTASVVSTYATYTVTSNAGNIKPIKTASINSTYGGYTASVSATMISNNRSASVNGTYAQYSAIVQGTNTKPVKSASINGTYVQYGATVTGTNVKPVKTASISVSYPVYTVSVQATKQALGFSASVNTTYAAYGASVSSTNIKPIKTASVIGSYNKYTSSVSSTNVKPIKSVSIATSYAGYTANVSARAVNTLTAAVNSNYPKYAAQVNATLFGNDRTASISASYPTYIGTVVIGEFLSLPYIGGKGAHLIISLGSRDVILKEKSREIKWRVENARL